MSVCCVQLQPTAGEGEKGQGTKGVRTYVMGEIKKKDKNGITLRKNRILHIQTEYSSTVSHTASCTGLYYIKVANLQLDP
jgi:hypothetical protein